MILDLVLSNRTAWKILELLSYEPGRGLNRKEIKKFTRVGNRVIDNSLKLLKKYNVVLTDKSGRIVFYKINLANQFAEKILELIKTEKQLLNNISYEFLLPVKEFVHHLIQIIKLRDIENIILFGSVAKGTARTDSDIDIAVITADKIKTKDKLLVSELAENIKKRFGKTVQTHYFSLEEYTKLKKSRDKLIEEIERSRIILL